MIIGRFEYSHGDQSYHGSLTTLAIQHFGITISPNEKSNDKEPDYRIFASQEFGPLEFGAAWKRRTEGGREFLSVSLDDPSFSAPINAALFTEADGERFSLVWSRPRSKMQTVEVANGRPRAKSKKAA